MRLKFRGAGVAMKFADGQPKFEAVRDDEWGPSNPYPCSTAEICKMSPEQYRSWKETGRKPVMDDDPIQEFEPVADRNCNAAEAFARNSDRRHGYDSGQPTADEMARMTPGERFKAASDARNRIGARPGRAEDVRRRRSE